MILSSSIKSFVCTQFMNRCCAAQTTLQAPPPLTISHAESLARQMGLEDARRQGRSDLNSMLELPPNFFSTQPTRWPPVLHGGQMGQPSTLYLESFHVQPTQPFTSFVGSQEGTLHPQQPPQYQRTPMQDQCLYQQPALLATGQQVRPTLDIPSLLWFRSALEVDPI
jgi:hypothetical protein